MFGLTRKVALIVKGIHTCFAMYQLQGSCIPKRMITSALPVAPPLTVVSFEFLRRLPLCFGVEVSCLPERQDFWGGGWVGQNGT